MLIILSQISNMTIQVDGRIEECLDNTRNSLLKQMLSLLNTTTNATNNASDTANATSTSA
jgi:hypothetical protein